ncbi:phosphotransferase family protein [Trinickia acidisoli]|uniref:phosphotransferase family protein n=1 Tax=Trinickia acidisoli TaxID=2767482 RepID=UPI001A8E174B|nr:aminoglycoside phosphotransferase family protein [Trinickia acidisoli]
MISPIELPGTSPIGSGRTADVFAWNTHWVLKLFHQELSHNYAHGEQRIARAVREALHDAAFCVPEVGEVVVIQARVGLVYARAAGTLLTRAYAQKDPHRLAIQVGERLAELHLDIHRVDSRTHRSLDALPDQRQRFRRAIGSVTGVSDEHRHALLCLLEEVDCTAHSLCHGDFHPHNVLQDENGRASVIDWVIAERGNPLCDAATTSLLLRFAPIAGAARTDPAHAAMRRVIRHAYLSRYFAVDDNAQRRAQFERWLPLAAAVRVANRIGAAERADLLALIERRLTPQSAGLRRHSNVRSGSAMSETQSFNVS